MTCFSTLTCQRSSTSSGVGQFTHRRDRLERPTVHRSSRRTGSAPASTATYTLMTSDLWGRQPATTIASLCRTPGPLPGGSRLTQVFGSKENTCPPSNNQRVVSVIRSTSVGETRLLRASELLGTPPAA